jgi:putative membrane protein
MHGWEGGSWGHMWTMGLFWIVMLVAAVALIVWLVRAGSGGGGTGQRPSAEELLRERYARGEIDDEEYRKRLDELRRG